MNICLVSGEYPPENGWGGVATYTLTMAKSLARLGHRVFVVAGPAPKAASLVIREGVEVHRISPSQAHYYAWRLGVRFAQLPKLIKRVECQIAVAGKIRELSSRHGLDVVEYADSYADGFFHSLFNHCRYVVKLHVPYWVLMKHHQSETARMIGWMEKSFVRRASLIVSPSNFLAHETARRYRIPLDRIVILPNPVDSSVFSPATESKDATRTVLFVGWHTELKGVDVLVAAIPGVIESYPNVRFVLIGGEPPETNVNLKQQLTRMLAAQIGLGQVEFREFTTDRCELASLYQASNLCVVPSRFENFPCVCLEAMSCGCAVVASRVGGIPEIVDDGVTGLLVEAGNPAKLASAIKELLSDPLKLRDMGRAGRAKAVKEFDAGEIARRNVALYESLLSIRSVADRIERHLKQGIA